LSIRNNPTEAVEPRSAIWRERLQIHSYEVDFRKRATAPSLCRAFLEAAWNHAEQLGFGYAELARQNKLWVLARLFLQFDRYPHWGDTVEIATWPRGISGAFALRDFEICTLERKRLGTGSSSWLVLDAETHRPQRIDKLLIQIPRPNTVPAIVREPKKLGKLEAATRSSSATVCYSDLDVNRHVNSARYISWLLDTYSADFLEQHTLQSLEVNYVGEGRWADALSVLCRERGPNEFSHLIIKSDQSEVCRAELYWVTESADVSETPP
jgi:acyl-ACP thioesterase